jgi:TolB protein
MAFKRSGVRHLATISLHNYSQISLHWGSGSANYPTNLSARPSTARLVTMRYTLRCERCTLWGHRDASLNLKLTQILKNKYTRYTVGIAFLIFILPATGGILLQPTLASDCIEQQPRPSPNGERIAFRSDCEGRFHLYILSLETGTAERLDSSDDSGIGVSWSPDGRSIVYYLAEDEEDNEIKVLDVASGSSHVISTGEYDQSPGWSPDGRRILFTSGEIPMLDLFTIEPDGKNRQRLGGTDGPDWGAAWSPTGREVVFNSVHDSRVALFLMDADGSNVRALSKITMIAETPAISPSGTLIAFQANSDIYVYDTDTTELTRLTDNPARDEIPAWSQDGRIYFQSDRDGDMDIFVMNTNGSNQVKIPISYN